MSPWPAARERDGGRGIARLPGHPSRELAIFWLIGAAALIAGALELFDVAGRWLLFEDVQLVLAPLAGAIAISLTVKGHDGEDRRLRRSLAVSLVLTTLGQFIRDVPDAIPATAAFAGGLSDAVYVTGAVIGINGLMQVLFQRLEPDQRRGMLVDGLILMLTATALVIAAWEYTGRLAAASEVVATLGTPMGLALIVMSASFFASAAAAALVAFALRVAPSLGSVWAVLAGIVLISAAWVGWLARFMGQGPDTIEPMDFTFLVGALALGYGGLTWDLRAGQGRRYRRFAGLVTEWLPLVAVVVAGMAELGIRQGIDQVSLASLAAWFVVFAAIGRMRLTRLEERAASRRLTREVQERAATSVALARLDAAETAELTADRICAEALTLPGIDTASLYLFDGLEAVVPLAVRGFSSFPTAICDALPVECARRLRHHADFGLWLEQWEEASKATDDTTSAAAAFARAMRESGVFSEAIAPLYWNDEPFGILGLGATSAAHVHELPNRLPALTDFSLVAAALLGPLVAQRRETNELRREIAAIIAGSRFHPVFQPFVELASGRVVGHEALTRFDDGRRPDLRFADAAAVGMGIELEKASLTAQLDAAGALPDGTWVSLNVSPELAVDGPWLVEALARVPRGVVVEITEHVEVVDYERLLAGLASVRARAKLAVDDAGAGYAGLRHILELRPEFVKLDISLVRSIDTDPARRAMVAGMAHFAAGAGCELIAEGIETPAELEVLRRFDVRYGQGYLLGRPAAVTLARDTDAAA